MERLTASAILSLTLLLLAAVPAPAQQQPVANVAQERIERAIGALFVENANLAAQVQSLSAENARLKAELDERGKQAPTSAAPSGDAK